MNPKTSKTFKQRIRPEVTRARAALAALTGTELLIIYGELHARQNGYDPKAYIDGFVKDVGIDGVAWAYLREAHRGLVYGEMHSPGWFKELEEVLRREPKRGA
jgi:hypothetical protein